VIRYWDLALGIALLAFTLALAIAWLCIDAPVHALQEFGIAAIVAWRLPSRDNERPRC
jgi:hypothetical protein